MTDLGVVDQIVYFSKALFDHPNKLSTANDFWG